MLKTLKSSVKIKQKRKVKYPSKRINYRRYKNANWEWKDIFIEIDNLVKNKTYNYLAIISNKYNIPNDTLFKKYKLWKLNGNIIDYNLENRGGKNKSFTETEEKDLYDYIVNVFIRGNLILTNEHVQLLATQKYISLHKKDIVDTNTFIFSDAWITQFKHRWKLSSVKVKISHIAVNLDQKELDQYLLNCEYYKNNVQREFIFNLDETFWRLLSGMFSVIGIENSDCRKINSSINPKAGFTTIFIISANGVLLKPSIIMKGKTKNSLKKISEIPDNDVNKHYSNSGWINVGILIFLLNEIVQLTKKEKSVLILDQYSSHQNDELNNIAKSFNIKLEFVPIGMTSTRQPLDVNFNGPVKSIGRSLANNGSFKRSICKIYIGKFN